jgi:hypothetical protein
VLGLLKTPIIALQQELVGADRCLHAEPHQTVLLRVWEITEQNAVDYAEDGCGSADTQCHRGSRHQNGPGAEKPRKAGLAKIRTKKAGKGGCMGG